MTPIASPVRRARAQLGRLKRRSGWRTARNAAAEGVQQLLCYGMRGTRDSDAVLAARHDVVDVVGLGQNQGQGTRQNLAANCSATGGSEDTSDASTGIVQMHDHG